MITIVLDPGHGGQTKVGGSSPNNAIGQNGTLEKSITLQIAKAAQLMAPENVKIVLTRDTDMNLGLSSRAAIARIAKAEIFISIHLNAWELTTTQGTETYHHTYASQNSTNLAAFVQSEVLAVTQVKDRGVKKEQWGVLKPAYHDEDTACCLVEVSFLTDPNEELKFSNQSYISSIASSINRACAKYLTTKYQSLFALADDRPEDEFEDVWGYLSMRGRKHHAEEELEDAASLNLRKKQKPLPSTKSPRGRSKPSDKIAKNKNVLTRIKGIGKVRENILIGQGIPTFRVLASLSKNRQRVLSDIMNVSETTVARWVSEAKSISKEK